MKSLMGYCRGVISVIAYLANIIFWCTPVIVLALLKLIPIRFYLRWVNAAIQFCANSWVATNSIIQSLLHPITVSTNQLPELSPEESYLLVCNHQSGIDILLLQALFHKKIPLLRFFLKQQLIWVPLLGVAWWALDFPFMQRYSRSFLAKHPHLKGKDLESTKRACDKFNNIPVTIVNFVEGTRYTKAKYAKQQPPFQHLLKPKAGGIAFTLSAMEHRLAKLIDVSIHYNINEPNLWQYFCGRIEEVRINVKTVAVSHLNGKDYFNNDQDRQSFQVWLNECWQQKDQWLMQYNKSQRGVENDKP